MKIISIVNEKGGVGKTTLVTNLASAMAKNSKIIGIDTDKQGSFSMWGSIKKPFQIMPITHHALLSKKEFQKIDSDYDNLIIDGAPSIDERTQAIIDISDVLVIPVQASGVDFWATERIIKILELYQDKKAGFVITRRIKNTGIDKNIETALSENFGLPIWGSTYQRISYVHALNDGVSVFDTKDESAQNEIREILINLIS